MGKERGFSIAEMLMVTALIAVSAISVTTYIVNHKSLNSSVETASDCRSKVEKVLSEFSDTTNLPIINTFSRQSNLPAAWKEVPYTSKNNGGSYGNYQNIANSVTRALYLYNGDPTICSANDGKGKPFGLDDDGVTFYNFSIFRDRTYVDDGGNNVKYTPNDIFFNSREKTYVNITPINTLTKASYCGRLPSSSSIDDISTNFFNIMPQNKTNYSFSSTSFKVTVTIQTLDPNNPDPKSNVLSQCQGSTYLSYTSDINPPTLTINNPLTPNTSSSTVTFSANITSSKPGSMFECSLDGGANYNLCQNFTDGADPRLTIDSVAIDVPNNNQPTQISLKGTCKQFSTIPFRIRAVDTASNTSAASDGVTVGGTTNLTCYFCAPDSTSPCVDDVKDPHCTGIKTCKSDGSNWIGEPNSCVYSAVDPTYKTSYYFTGTTCAAIQDGKCGPANGEPSVTAPLTKDLCDTGTSTVVTKGATDWTWTCKGTPSGASPSCSAPIAACTSGNTTTCTEKNGYCSGTKTCNSSGQWDLCIYDKVLKSGATISSGNCIPPTKVDGVCGTGNGGSFKDAPSGSVLCKGGSPSLVTGTGPWYWNCVGKNGGVTDSCKANKTSGPCGWNTYRMESSCSSTVRNRNCSSGGAQIIVPCNSVFSGRLVMCADFMGDVCETDQCTPCSPPPTPSISCTYPAYTERCVPGPSGGCSPAAWNDWKAYLIAQFQSLGYIDPAKTFQTEITNLSDAYNNAVHKCGNFGDYSGSATEDFYGTTVKINFMLSGNEEPVSPGSCNLRIFGGIGGNLQGGICMKYSGPQVCGCQYEGQTVNELSDCCRFGCGSGYGGTSTGTCHFNSSTGLFEIINTSCGSGIRVPAC